ncbi:YcjF family protein [Puniceibacterium sediminis]|uniref:Uncharacterized conserved protein, DUF697 family n=1 Tax=Puniceibacterium sediminis TaxID=1608407 RepID=A0A238Z9T6_9RHOB|nr:DUF697 domain-containing protein [Puniceibacterium sediminis]SNR80295.1 Uncharacterized conserved protein, DUF697 family [Puniceibacterium sediminis]
MATATISKDNDKTANAVDIRHQKVAEIISSSVKWSAAGGVVPVPYLDLLAVGAVQVQMVRKLAAAYGQEADEQNLKAIITSLLGTLAPAAVSTTLLGSSVKLIPISGTLLGSAGMAAFAAASTYAIGKVFVRHFEGGGSMLDFSVDAIKKELQEEFSSSRAN